MMRFAATLLLGVTALASCGRAAPPAPAGAAAPAGLAVDAAWLAANATATDLVVLQVAPDAAPAVAIPGARLIPLSAVAVEREGVPNELPALDDLRATFEQAGVGDSSRVIIIGEPLHAARAFVALDVLGHTRVSLLDGGTAAWGDAGRPAFTPPPTPARLTGAARPDLVVDADYVRERIGSDDVLLLDARPDDQYAAGRIPGAASLFWQHTLRSPDDARLLPTGELHTLFDNAGGDDATSFVIYCRTGMQASFLYFVARHLGYDVRLYDGSLTDWSARALPVEP